MRGNTNPMSRLNTVFGAANSFSYCIKEGLCVCVCVYVCVFVCLTHTPKENVAMHTTREVERERGVGGEEVCRESERE